MSDRRPETVDRFGKKMIDLIKRFKEKTSLLFDCSLIRLVEFSLLTTDVNGR